MRRARRKAWVEGESFLIFILLDGGFLGDVMDDAWMEGVWGWGRTIVDD